MYLVSGAWFGSVVLISENFAPPLFRQAGAGGEESVGCGLKSRAEGFGGRKADRILTRRARSGAEDGSRKEEGGGIKKEGGAVLCGLHGFCVENSGAKERKKNENDFQEKGQRWKLEMASPRHFLDGLRKVADIRGMVG